MALRGRLAVVTGASSGIGAATARLLAREGARVVLMARTESALEEVAAGIRPRGEKRRPSLPTSVTPAAATAACERIVRETGVPDLLVNNAGAGRWLFTEETPPVEAVAMMAAPYFAAFFATRAFLPGMLARGSGRIVNVNSPASKLPWPGAAGYTSARWALRGFTLALRQELAGSGVGVTHFVAGKTSSEYFAHNPGAEERIPRISKLIPTLTPEDAAKALVGAVHRDADEAVVPFMLRLFWISASLTPGITAWLLRKTGARRPG